MNELITGGWVLPNLFLSDFNIIPLFFTSEQLQVFFLLTSYR